MSYTKNIFDALSEDSAPKPSTGQPKKKGKKKTTPLNLNPPPVSVPAHSPPRHPLRTEMTEDEELRMALEASKNEAERSKQQQTNQWSTIAKTASTQGNTVATGTQLPSTATVKAKTTAASNLASTTVKPPVSTTVRPPTNPWAPNLTNKTNSLENTQTGAQRGPNMAAAESKSTQPSEPIIHDINSENLKHEYTKELVEEEMYMAPLVTSIRPRRNGNLPAVLTQPIARPSDIESMALDMHSIVISSVIEDDTVLPINNGSMTTSQVGGAHPVDLHSSTSLSTSTQSSGLSSPVTSLPQILTSNIPAPPLQQLHDVLQLALQKITHLEQTNEYLSTRMSQIVDASMQLESVVMTLSADNASLQAQIQEIRTKLAVVNQLSNSSSDGPSAFYLSPSPMQTAYANFFSPQQFTHSNPARSQDPSDNGGTSPSLHPHPLSHFSGAPNSTPSSSSHPSAVLSVPSFGQQDHSSFSSNGLF